MASASSVPDSFICPITSELMADPVSTADGFSYEREAIEQWLTQHTTSPLTNAPLTSASLLPNLALRSAIMQLVAERPELKAQLYVPKPSLGERPNPAPAAPEPAEPTAEATAASVWDSARLQAAAAAATAPWASEKSNDLVLKVERGEYGGTRLVAKVLSDAGMERLAARVSAASSAVLESLEITSDDGGSYGASAAHPASHASARGSVQPRGRWRYRLRPLGRSARSARPHRMWLSYRCAHRRHRIGRLPRSSVARRTGNVGHEASASGPAFGRLVAAIAPGSLTYSVHALREIKISKLELAPAAAVALASALRNHPSLESLELWNVQLEDEPALVLAALGARDGNDALRRLNLGRNLLNIDTKERIEALVDTSRVQLRVY